MDTKDTKIKTFTHTKGVHSILAHSYSVYLLMFLFGFFLDTTFPVKIFEGNTIRYFGFFLLLFASVLIFWAQKTSRNLSKEKLTKESFLMGPYNFTRGPTHLGLFLLVVGFGMIANTVFVIFFTIISFFITRMVFLKEQEMLLEERYGEPYKEYKKIVRF